MTPSLIGDDVKERPRAEYRCPTYYPAVLLIGVAVGVAVWIGALGSASNLSELAVRCILLSIPTSILAYGYGWRVAYRLTTDGVQVHWRAPLGRGSIAIGDIRTVRDAIPRVDGVELRTGKGVAVFVRIGSGLADFVSVLKASNPAMTVSASTRWRSVERSADPGFRWLD